MQKLQTVQAETPGLQAYMVTLTVKDGPDLSERFQHLRGSHEAHDTGTARPSQGPRKESSF